MTPLDDRIDDLKRKPPSGMGSKAVCVAWNGVQLRYRNNRARYTMERRPRAISNKVLRLSIYIERLVANGMFLLGVRMACLSKT